MTRAAYKTWKLTPLLLMMLLLSSCFEEACTDIYAFHTITVVDSTNQAVNIDSFTVTNLDTNEVYPICDDANVASPCLVAIGDVGVGKLEIMNDSFLDSLSKAGSNIRVTGQKGEFSFQADYVFRSDGCHIEYVSGLDTVMLSN